MTAFRRGKNQQIYVPLRSGGLVQRSCGTPSLAIRNKLKALVVELRDDQRWTLLDALVAKPPRLTLLALYQANAAKQLQELEARLSSSVLADYVDGWKAWLTASGRVDETVELYDAQVATFRATLGAVPSAVDITPARVAVWLAGLTAKPVTRRKYYYALKSFVAYLRTMGALVGDPLAGYKPPAKGKARVRWETAAVDQKIVEAASEQYRALFAFIKGTGADVGAALRTLRRDVDLERGVTLIRGTKTAEREVPEAAIEAWALPFVRAHAKPQLPNAPLWPGLTRSGAYHHHQRCCEAVKVESYTLKDARHSVAVRMRFRGAEFEEIADQLGNSVYQVATVYARFRRTDPRAIDALRAGGQGNV